MKSYSKAPEECSDRVAHLITLFHPGLRDAGLRIDLISVANDDPDAHALTLNGYPCAAVVRIIDPKGRTMGRGDAEIVIDEARYLPMTDPEKDALLDHEIYHIELQLGKNDRVKLDENGRPKLKLRKHDYQFGWFEEIAKRHAAASMEIKQATRLFLAEKQTFFAFAMDTDLRQRLEMTTTPESPADDSTARRFVRNMAANLKDDGSVTISTSGAPGFTIDKHGLKKTSRINSK